MNHPYRRTDKGMRKTKENYDIIVIYSAGIVWVTGHAYLMCIIYSQPNSLSSVPN